MGRIRAEVGWGVAATTAAVLLALALVPTATHARPASSVPAPATAAFLFRTTYEFAQTTAPPREDEDADESKPKRKRKRRTRPSRDQDRDATERNLIAERYGVLTRNGVSYLDARTVDVGFFQEQVDAVRPAVIKNAFWPQDPASDGAGPVDENARAASDTRTKHAEHWTERLFGQFADREVQFQTRSVRDRGSRPLGHLYDGGDEPEKLEFTVDTHSATMSEFVDLAFSSSHWSSCFLLDEDLLSEAPDLVQELQLPERLWPRDMFDLFPALVRPKKPCLIMGGAGARSVLHVDPFEWTGWNYLVEGAKLWTFFPPDSDETVGENDQILDAMRMENTAWDDQGRFNISAGWTSPVDLYHQRVMGKSLDWPSAAALGVMPAVARQHAVAHIRNNSEISHQFKPSRPLSLTSSAGVQPTRGMPSTRRRVSVLQQEGELLLIPPRWWHQTYNLEPSVAVAGQYLNAANEKNVYSHILEWAGAPDKLPEGTGEGLLAGDDQAHDQARARIHEVLRAALRSQHGTGRGDELFEELLELDD